MTKKAKKEKPVKIKKEKPIGNSSYFILLLYLGSSVIYFFWPLSFVPLVFWFVSLLVFQFSHNNFIRAHAIQVAAINLIFVFFIYGEIFLRRLLTEQISSQSGMNMLSILPQVVHFVVAALQIWGAESALRGMFVKIPLVFPLAQKQASLIFGEENIED